MSLTRKIATNTIIQFIGKIISILLGVITIAIMARYLGALGFGQYSTIMAYLQFFAILVDLGLSLTVVRLITDPQHNQTTIFNNVFTLRIVSALLFLGLAPLIVLFFPYDNLVKVGIALTTIAFLFTSLNQIFVSLFQKELSMTRATIAEIGGRIILLTLIALFAYFNKGLLAIMLAVVLASFVQFLLNYFLALRFVKIKLLFDYQIWAKIIHFTWPIALSIAFNLVYFKADTLILSLFRSQTEVGLYSAPYRVLEILTNFIYMFMGIIFPILTLEWSQKNLPKFQALFQKTWDFLVILAVPLVFGTLFVAKDLMLLIAGPEFAPSGLILQIIIFATAIIFLNSLYGYAIVVIDKQKAMVWAYVFVAIFSLAGYLILIPPYGYFGAAIFTVASEILIFIFNLVVTYKTTKFLPKNIIFLKTIAASLVMSAVLYFLAGYNVLFLIIIASVVYVLSLYVFKGFSKELILEILQLKSQNKN